MVHYTLNRAPYTIRLLSSLFLVFALWGQVIVVLYGTTRFGLSPDGAQNRYAGDDEKAAAPSSTPNQVPTIVEPFDDDDDEEAINLSAVKAPEPAPKKALFFSISWDELLRLTHVHTFAGGMLFYILGHIFVLTTVRTWLKRTLLLVFFFSLATFIGGPFLIRYVSQGAVYPFLVAIFGFLGCGLFFAGAALWDMWGPPSRPPVGPKGAARPES
jgi:hypothetical protein